MTLFFVCFWTNFTHWRRTFLFCFCWIILTTVFPGLVNDDDDVDDDNRKDGSYLIVLFYLMEYRSRIAVVKLTKRGIYDFFVWLSLNV